MEHHEAFAKSPLPLLYQLQELKHLPRTGWLRFVPDCETVASHSWRLAFLGLFAPEPLDRQKCMFIGLVHDLAEAYAGDIPKFANFGKDKKKQLETTGFKWIESLVQPGHPELAAELTAAWKDYDDGRTPEGRWMKQMDKLECLVQAKEYEERTFGQKDLGEFQGLLKLVNDPTAKAWADLLSQERLLHLKNRTARLPVIFIIGDDDHGQAFCTEQARDDRFRSFFICDILTQKCGDHSFTHRQFLEYCLKENFDVPKPLLVQVLEEALRRSADTDGRVILLQGFPSNLGQLVEYERKVQTQHLSVNLSHPRASEAEDNAKGIAWQAEVSPVAHLRSAHCRFEEVTVGEGDTEGFPQFKAAVERLTEAYEGQ